MATGTLVLITRVALSERFVDVMVNLQNLTVMSISDGAHHCCTLRAELSLEKGRSLESGASRRRSSPNAEPLRPG